jgi:predicted PurR-regulated permease PerM
LQFRSSFPILVEKGHALIDQVVLWWSNHLSISTYKINIWISEKYAEILTNTNAALAKTIMITGSLIVMMILIPVYVFMILFYQPLLLEFIHRLFNSKIHKQVNEVLSETKKIIQNYLLGLLLEAAIIALLNVASLLLLGIDFAILLGVIGAILNVVPYLGGIVALLLTMTISLITNSAFSSLTVLIAFVFIQLIDNNFIVPKIVASKVKINGLASIVVVLIGGALWGIPGMFLSIPLLAIVKVIFDHIESLKPWGYLLGDTMQPIFEIKKILRVK